MLQVPWAPSGAQVRQGKLTCRRQEFGRWPELQEAVRKATKKRRRPAKRPKTTAYREPSVPKGSDGPASSSASKPPRPKNQGETKSHITVEYGCWSCKGEDINVGKPIALILFSGRSRPGDLHNQLVSLGWIVCSVDMAAPIKTNILDDAQSRGYRASPKKSSPKESNANCGSPTC